VLNAECWSAGLLNATSHSFFTATAFTRTLFP
jgi:hypothetical protein